MTSTPSPHLGLSTLFLLALLPAARAQEDLDDFHAKSSVRKEFHNFNVETVRGMALNPDATALFAINTHGSRLVRFDVVNLGAPQRWITLHNPVAMALWEEAAGYHVVVAGGATHALAVHDPTSGEVTDLFPLPSEPGDVVVSADGRAYVSCMGTNEVVEIVLVDGTRTSYAIPSSRPRFLFLEEGPSAGEHRVFVTPFVSGNNTTLDDGPDPHVAKALDDPATPGVLEGLPDEDLFEIIWDAAEPEVEARVRGIGHLVLDHGKSPGGLYHVLTTVSNNADPGKPTEQDLRGDFALNAVSVFTMPDRDTPPIVAPPPIDLDLFQSTDYTSAQSCSFPFSIEFLGPNLSVVASSTGDRLVFLDGQGQRITAPLALPAGSIPRDVLFAEPWDSLLVYLWGTNQIWAMHTSGATALLDLGLDPTPASIAAGREIWYDAERSANARSSCNTCHPGGGSDFLGWSLSTTPDDRKDVMVTQSLLSIEDTFPYHWRGERELRDFSRLAFTGLLGADAALATEPDPVTELVEAEVFQEFVFSLQAPRNPYEDLSRKVVDIVDTLGSGISGRAHFEDEISFGNFTCMDCHTGPTSSNGTAFALNLASVVPQATHLEVAHLRQMFNKVVRVLDESHDPPVMVDANVLVEGESLPLLGWGLSHDGTDVGFRSFLAPFSLGETEKDDVAEYLLQLDQGLAPAAQSAWRLAEDDDLPEIESTKLEIDDFLLTQAKQGWLDVIVFGTVVGQGETTPQHVRWFYDPEKDKFFANDSSIKVGSGPGGRASFDDLVDQATEGKGSNTFVGVPPGNGRRLALDPDNDQLEDPREVVHGTLAENPDSDGDGDPDGHEVAHGGDPLEEFPESDDDVFPALELGYPKLIDTRGTTTQLELLFSEPVRYTITYQRVGEQPLTRDRLDPVLQDTIVLQELTPSSQAAPGATEVPSSYTISLTMKDLAEPPNVTVLPDLTVTTLSGTTQGSITTLDQIEPRITNDGLFEDVATPLHLVLKKLELDPGPGGITDYLDLDAKIVPLHEGADDEALVEHLILAGQVLVDDGQGWTLVPAADLELLNEPPGLGPKADYILRGPDGTDSTTVLGDVLFLGPANKHGRVNNFFRVTNGLNPGNRLRFNVVGIYRAFGTSPDGLPPVEQGLPVLKTESGRAWQITRSQDDPIDPTTGEHDPELSLRGQEVQF